MSRCLEALKAVQPLKFNSQSYPLKGRYQAPKGKDFDRFPKETIFFRGLRSYVEVQGLPIHLDIFFFVVFGRAPKCFCIVSGTKKIYIYYLFVKKYIYKFIIVHIYI